MLMVKKKHMFWYCHVLILPLLFLIPPHLLTHPLMRLPIPGTASLLSLSSLILSLLTLLISSLVLLLNQLISAPYYVLCLILLTTSLSSTLIVLTETPQSFGSQPRLIRLTRIPWSILPFVTNMSALLTTLIVVTNELSSYLLILSLISMDLLLIPSYCPLHVSAIFSPLLFPDFLLFPYVSARLLQAHYCSQYSTRLRLLLYIRPSCWALRP